MARASLVARVARSAAVFAAASALLSALIATLLARALLEKAEDRRLRDAALVLCDEIGMRRPQGVSLEQIARDEHEETKHAGLRFAVLDGGAGVLAGDARLPQPAAGRCSTDADGALRACAVSTDGALRVVAAAYHTRQTEPFLLAAVAAMAVSGLLTWLASRPVARAAVAPFSRLRSRVAAIDVRGSIVAELGPAEEVEEVDALRTTIGQLVQRVGAALEQAQRFSANAAHELRTPLTAVRAELDLLSEREALPEGVQENLAGLRAKVAELGRLVEKLLILAAPKRILEQANEVVSLRDVLEDVTRSLAKDEQQRIVLPANDAIVAGDAVLLATMFANALSNGLKFGKRVEVTLTSSAGRVVVAVDDDGPGVDRAHREQLFEPFYRGQDALRRRVPGHGLGLALVRHVAESHGGSAAFAERAERGARLQIEMPELVE